MKCGCSKNVSGPTGLTNEAAQACKSKPITHLCGAGDAYCSFALEQHRHDCGTLSIKTSRARVGHAAGQIGISIPAGLIATAPPWDVQQAAYQRAAHGRPDIHLWARARYARTEF